MTNSYGDPPPPTAADGRNAAGLLMVALAFLATFLLLRSTLGRKPAEGVADYSWKFEDLDGKAYSLARFKGRPIFLNVWATSCGPCRQEMPSIARLASHPKLKGVTFLCVSQDLGMAEVKAYCASAGSQPMTILHSLSPAPKVFESDVIPATFVIAPDGRIVKSQIGSIDWDAPEVIELLEGLTKG